MSDGEDPNTEEMGSTQSVDAGDTVNGSELSLIDNDSDLSDDCPSAVSSDDSEEECAETWEAMAEKWLSQSRLEAEVHKMNVQCAGLFLFGIDSCVPEEWTTAMVNAKAIESRERMASLDEMSEKHLKMSDILKEIFTTCEEIHKPENKEQLEKVLEMVDSIEQDCLKDKTLDVQKAVDMAKTYPFFEEKWNSLSRLKIVKKYIRHEAEGRDLPILFSLLLYYKLVHEHISYFGSHKGTKADKIVRDLINSSDSNYCDVKYEGSIKFREQDYAAAIELYTTAMRKDYGSPVLYTNRSQCYLFQEEYWKAYCDCMRTIFLAPKWFKGYFRCAEACAHLKGRMEEALEMNGMAEKLFRDAVANGAVKDQDKSLLTEVRRQQYRLSVMGNTQKGLLTQHDTDPDPDLYVENMPAYRHLATRVKNSNVPPAESADSSGKTATKANSSSRDKAKAQTPPKPSEHSKGPEQNGNGVSANSASAPQNDNSGETAKTASDGRDKAKAGPQPREHSEVEKFKVNLKEALEAYNLDNMVRACGKYQAAINLWTTSPQVRSSIKAEDMIVVRYAFGVTAVAQDNVKSLMQDGLHTLQAMYKADDHRFCPVVLCGLCRAFTVFHRYSEALEVIQVEVPKALKESWSEFCWPRSEQVIEESKQKIFKQEMKKLRDCCRYPPRADAVCRIHADIDEGRGIFVDSPLYGGMVSMWCHQKCCLKFHIPCWKVYKSKLYSEKISEKEMMEKDCPTPDCGSFICMIVVDKPGKKQMEFRSELQPSRQRKQGRVVKMKPSSQYTIARRQERKELRKQKREEHFQRAFREFMSLLSAQRLPDISEICHGQHLEPEQANAPLDGLVMLQKEGEEDLENKYNSFQKPARKKKKEKKEKGQSILAVEVNFTDTGDREVVGGYDLEEEEEMPSDQLHMSMRGLAAAAAVQAEPAVDSRVPTRLITPMESFSKVVASTLARQPALSERDESVRKALQLLLHDILKEAGPQHHSDLVQLAVFQDVAEQATRIFQESGGLLSYFERNSDFVVIGEFVGVKEDYEKVEQLYEMSCSSAFMPANTYPMSLDPYNSNPSFVSSIGDIGTTNSNWSSDSMMAGVDVPQTVPSFTQAVMNREMTLPTIQQELNPAAPEFQPSPPKQKQTGLNDIDEINLGWKDTTPAVTMKVHNERVDSLDSFTSAADDVDIEGAHSADRDLNMHDIDEIDLEQTVSSSYSNQEEFGANQQVPVQDILSRRSSLSELSQTGSDYSTGLLFRTASPSSSSSSHKAASTWDRGSPFSARDTTSPALCTTIRTGDLARKTASPVGSASLASVLADHLSSGQDVGTSSGPSMSAFSEASTALTSSSCIASNGDTTRDSSVTTMGVLPVNASACPVPKPLKPLTAMGSSTSRNIGIGSKTASGNKNIISSSATAGTSSQVQSSHHSVSEPQCTPSNSDLSLSTSSVYPGSDSALSATAKEWNPVKHGGASSTASGFIPGLPVWPAAPFPNPAFPSSALPSSSSSPTTWGGLTYPGLDSWTTSSVQPSDETVVPSVPNNHVFSLSSTMTGPHSAWSSGDMARSGWDSARLGRKDMVDVEIQTSVDYCNAEVNTDLSQLDIMSLQEQQHNMQLMVLDRQHMHMQIEKLKLQLKEMEEEKHAAWREVEAQKEDLRTAVRQMQNMEAENTRVQELQASREQFFLSEIKTAQTESHAKNLEMSSLRDRCTIAEVACNTERERAIQAEVRVMQEQMENFRITLSSKIKDIGIMRKEFMMSIRSWQQTNPGQQPPEHHLQEVNNYFQKMNEALNQTLNSALAQLKERQELVKAGTHLSELTPVPSSAAQLPSPPECLKFGSNGLPVYVPDTRLPTSAHPTHLLLESFRDPPSVAPVASSPGPLQTSVGPPGLSLPSQPPPLKPPVKTRGVGIHPSASFPASLGSSSAASKLQLPGAPPPPLRPLNSKGLSGASQQRTMAQSVAAASAPAPMTKTQSSFGRLINTLQKSFPHCDQDMFTACIHELRRAHNGSLSGYDLSYIIHRISQMLMAKGYQPNRVTHLGADSTNTNSSSGIGIKYTPPPPGISPSLNVDVLEPRTGTDPYMEEEDPCAVCMEEMSIAPVQTLECQHRFHDKCIRIWFKHQTTCPKCRQHALLADDFPALK